jgi:DNA-binding response OmpR family regulator
MGVVSQPTSVQVLYPLPPATHRTVYRPPSILGPQRNVLKMLFATHRLEQPGEVVTREQLHQKLWSKDTFVDFDHGLNNAINRLRDALCESGEARRYIETLPRRGYRFVAPPPPACGSPTSG